MALSTIKRSILTQLKSLAGLPDIYYPNVDDYGDGRTNPPKEDYLRPDFMPNTTRPIGLKETDQEIGIFQVSIFIKKGKGELLSSDYGQIIIDGFPRNLQLDGVRFDNPASVGASFFDGAWQITPVSIFYQNIS